MYQLVRGQLNRTQCAGSMLGLGVAVCSFVLFCFLWSGGPHAQTDQSLASQWAELNSKTLEFHQQNRLAEAESSARGALAFARQFLPYDAPELGTSHNNLGSMLYGQGKYDASLAAHLEALDARQSQKPQNMADIASSHTNIADAYFAQRDYSNAAKSFRRAITILTEAQLDPSYETQGLAYALYYQEDLSVEETDEALGAMLEVASGLAGAQPTYADAYGSALSAVISLARDAERLSEVGSQAQALVDLRASATPVDNSALAWAFRYLAEVRTVNRDFAAAEIAYRSGIEEASKANGIYNQDTATLSYILGDMLADIGRFADAETAFRLTLDIERELYGDAHHETINSYNRLGLLLFSTGRSAAAEGLLRHGLELALEVHGDDSLWVATLSDNLGMAVSDRGNADEAIALHKKALQIRDDQLGRLDPSTSKTVNNLALALEKDGQFSAAQEYFREALEIDQKTLPEASWELGVAHSNLASSLAAMNTISASSEAYFHYREALGISRKNYPETHPDIADSLDSLATMAIRAGLFDDAAAYLREATSIYSAAQNRDRLAEQAVVFDAASDTLLSVSKTNVQEAFELAQWPMQTAASKAIAASAQRTAMGDPDLSVLIRSMQDQQTKHANLNDQVLASLSSTNNALRNTLKVQLKKSENLIATLQEELALRFPEFTQFQGGVPVSVADVSDVLDPDEALVFIRPGHSRVDGDQFSGSIFMVRADGSVAAARLERGDSLQQDARTLLCSVHAGTDGCPSVSKASDLTRGSFDLGGTDQNTPELAAFNLALAHDLYVRMFGPLETELRSVNRLIVVPGNEALAALPFQLLISEPIAPTANTEASAYQQARWMIKDWAITIQPNVSSLTHSRRNTPQSVRSVTNSFLGIGDPIIGSNASIVCGDDQSTQLSQLDRSVVSTHTSQLWTANAETGHPPTADVDAVRALTRLPDTRCELEQIADSLGNGNLLIAERANEALLKSMSAKGELKQYDIISFATHGLVAGEIANAEPALVLSPPGEGSIENDGLLTATEISQLDLNAEWVLLSACNTASGQITSGDGSVKSESFSGLARAFLYAGARNLLVSHWPVQSPAAVRLTTTTFEAMADDQSLDRSVAFQRSMLAIIDDPAATATTLHPRYWAPFTLLGDSR